MPRSIITVKFKTHIHTQQKKKRRTTEMTKSETILVNKKSTWSFLVLSRLMNLALSLSLSPVSLPLSLSLRSLLLSLGLSLSLYVSLSVFLFYLPFSCGLRLIMSSASARNSSSCAGPTFFNCLIATVDILILFKTGGREWEGVTSENRWQRGGRGEENGVYLLIFSKFPSIPHRI